MNKKTTGILLAASLTAVLAQLEADVTLDTRSINELSSYTASYTNLNVALVETPQNEDFRPLDDTNQIFSAPDMGAGETFSVTISGLNDYTYGAASISGFTAANIDGGNAGFGVVGGVASRLDVAGEAALVTFDLTGLTVAHQADFTLTGLSMGRWFDTEDFFNYAVYDADGDLKYAGAEDVGTFEVTGFDLNIAHGDVLVVGWDGVAGTSEFAFDMITVDVAAVPEPSAFALIGGALALGSVMLRRRR